ncbi:hypothetical protein HPB50_004270 [Hyalomma asiaticum]|uniref:Uncharacterized protein n=1 Tax=Hyalomma asiaticum TaxID=266040 RepID=A0ACB7TIE8_HYAAI|nr:hypothetical protein HPB50_004270 [Hyalomma asiaticum]
MGSALSCEVVTRCLFDGSGSVFSEDSPSEGTPCFTLSVTRPEVAKDVRYLSRDLTIEYERAGNRQLVPQLWNKDGVCLCGSCDEHRRTGLPGTRCDFLFETDVKEVQFAIQGPQYLASGELQMNSHDGLILSNLQVQYASCLTPPPLSVDPASGQTTPSAQPQINHAFLLFFQVDSTKCSLPDVDVC